MPKLIIIDAYQDTSNITGTDRMAFNFLVQLQNIDTTNTYKIICSSEDYVKSAVTQSNFAVLEPFLIIKQPFLKKIFNYFWRRFILIRFSLHHADTYCSFHNMRLPGGRVARRMVATNLDLIPLVLEEYQAIGRKTVTQTLHEYKRVAAQADCIISISNYSKAELSQRIDVDPDKIKVIPLAAGVNFSAPHRKPKVNPHTRNYILTIGGSEPRKNIQTVIDAYQLLPKELAQKYDLLITGGQWRQKILKTGPGIINLGYVDETQLPDLYRQATVFVFASSYEGFGFAILEAMASKVPVISASGSSLDEVASSAALLFNPSKTTELASQLTKLLSDRTLQKKLVEKGTQQNAKFSWEQSAKALHQILTPRN